MTAGMALAVGMAVWVFVIAAALAGHWYAKRSTLRRAARHDLEAARMDGCFEPGGLYDGLTAEDIANDLTCFGTECGGEGEDVLVAHVRAWMRSRGLL